MPKVLFTKLEQVVIVLVALGALLLVLPLLYMGFVEDYWGVLGLQVRPDPTFHAFLKGVLIVGTILLGTGAAIAKALADWYRDAATKRGSGSLVEPRFLRVVVGLVVVATTTVLLASLWIVDWMIGIDHQFVIFFEIVLLVLLGIGLNVGFLGLYQLHRMKESKKESWKETAMSGVLM